MKTCLEADQNDNFWQLTCEKAPPGWYSFHGRSEKVKSDGVTTWLATSTSALAFSSREKIDFLPPEITERLRTAMILKTNKDRWRSLQCIMKDNFSYHNAIEADSMLQEWINSE